jgi:hypothetical protein
MHRLHTNTVTFLYKGVKHLWILLSVKGLEANTPQIPRDKHTNSLAWDPVVHNNLRTDTPMMGYKVGSTFLWVADIIISNNDLNISCSSHLKVG